MSLMVPPSPPSKRKAWTYQPAAAPSLVDLLAGGEARRRFLRYWVRDNRGNIFDLTFFFTFRLVPATLCSHFGGWLGRVLVPRAYAVPLQRARANLETLFPDHAPDAIADMVDAYVDSQGRQMVEYSAVPRLARRSGGVRRVGVDHLKTCQDVPVIFMGLHLSNWEVLMQCLTDLGLKVSLNYDPPRSRARHWIVRHVRTRAGIALLPPGRQAVRPALRVLEESGQLLVFCDEGFNGQIRAPFLGRPANLQTNYALVARLARRTGARICPVYLTREAGVRFTLTILEPFALDGAASSLLDDVERLNGIVEPLVRMHAPQWYFVDNRLVS
ncbi:lysophospholipid acyltransferase family protein [Gluconacetobacter aggeris]|uniref:lysophospholipid acyltransferase family protein n=1 Tax=Gluconacetobacter aggeris TaxID=1286186 RepID=UPI001C810643|nr:hypothetical protein [Gluconacetobacter aggeris]